MKSSDSCRIQLTLNFLFLNKGEILLTCFIYFWLVALPLTSGDIEHHEEESSRKSTKSKSDKTSQKSKSSKTEKSKHSEKSSKEKQAFTVEDVVS